MVMPQRHPLYLPSKAFHSVKHRRSQAQVDFTSATEGQHEWNARRNVSEKSTHADGNVKPYQSVLKRKKTSKEQTHLVWTKQFCFSHRERGLEAPLLISASGSSSTHSASSKSKRDTRGVGGKNQQESSSPHSCCRW